MFKDSVSGICSFREQWWHTECLFVSVAWHLSHHSRQLDAHFLIPSVSWEWLMQWPHSTQICWKIPCWSLFKKKNKNKQTQLLKLPRLVFSVMGDNLSVGESACLRCEDDDVLPVGMKALRNKARPWNCHLLFFLLRLLKKKPRSINWEA